MNNTNRVKVAFKTNNNLVKTNHFTKTSPFYDFYDNDVIYIYLNFNVGNCDDKFMIILLVNQIEFLKLYNTYIQKAHL